MIGRVVALLSIPLTALALYGILSQVRREHRIGLWAPLIGLMLSPLMLAINLIFFRQAISGILGPVLLVLGLGFGLAWGQTARLRREGDDVVGRRSLLHLLFWGVSYAATQLLATFTNATWVTGGLVAMFFSTGSGLGTNLNLLWRRQRLRGARSSGEQGTTLPERGS